MCCGFKWQHSPHSLSRALSLSSFGVSHNRLTRSKAAANPGFSRKAKSLGSAGSSLLLHAAEGTGLDAGGGGKLDVLLGRDTNHEGGDVDHLLTNGNVLLADEHTGVMDRVADLSLHDEGLQTALHELSDGQTQNVIEFSLRLLEETEADHAADKGLTYYTLSYNHIY